MSEGKTVIFVCEHRVAKSILAATYFNKFTIGGKEYIDIFSQRDADHYQHLTCITTAAGTRTGLWAPDWNRLFVAVSHQAEQEAEIQVYELQP